MGNILIFAQKQIERIRDVFKRKVKKYQSNVRAEDAHCYARRDKRKQPFVEIEAMERKLMSTDEIRARSVCEVTYHPKRGTLNDPRMCPMEINQRCATCRGTVDTCSCHLGTIELPMPIYHVSYKP